MGNKKIAALLLTALVALFSLCGCSGVVDQAVSLGSQLGSAAAESVKGEISSVISEAYSGINQAKQEVSSAISEAQSEAQSAVSEAVSGAQSGISEGLNGAAEGLSEAGSEIEKKLSDIAETIVPSNDETTVTTTTTAETTTTAAAATTTSAAATAEKEQVWYTFRSQKLFDQHYEKHGAEFGDITQEEYLEMANELINSDSDRVLHKYSSDNDYMYFDQDTEYFLVLSEDGYIRTFFIPSAGISYWNRQ